MCFETQRIPGSSQAALSVLAWVEEASEGGMLQRRLVAGGLDGTLTEWDTTTLQPLASTDCFGGAVWALAVQPGPIPEGVSASYRSLLGRVTLGPCCHTAACNQCNQLGCVIQGSFLANVADETFQKHRLVEGHGTVLVCTDVLQVSDHGCVHVRIHNCTRNPPLMIVLACAQFDLPCRH